MPITVDEHPDSRGGSDTHLSRKYNVFGTQDEAAVIAAVLAHAPVAIGSLLHKTVSLEEINSEDPSGGYYHATVEYTEPTPADKANNPENAGTVDYEFNFQAPSVQIYQSLATIDAEVIGDGTAPNFRGAINVVNDGGKLRVEGFNLAPPPETFTLTFYDEHGNIDDTFKDKVESMVGKVNSTSFKGRPAGSLMLIRARGGGPFGILTTLELGFAYIENRDDIPVGDLTIGHKDGMDLLWAYYVDDADHDAKCLIKKPISAYVERIWYRADFNELGI